MKSVYVAELSPGDDVSELFALRRVDLKEYANGKMITLELVDKSGRVNGIIWEGTPELMKRLKTGGVYRAEGVVTTFKGENQLTVSKMNRVDKFDPEDFHPRGAKSYDDLGKMLDKCIEKIKDNDYKNLAETIFTDSDIRDSYLNGVGGKLWHHNYLGGLAEHSLSMFKICEGFCSHYDELDRDLLLTGALLHDIGKIDTYSIAAAIEYTDEGRLLGHIVMGDELVREAIGRLESFPENKELKIRHLILSHQGSLEQASPVVPMMSEGIALYSADLLDSKLAAIRRIRDKEKTPGVAWSNYVKLLDRHIYFSDEDNYE